MVDTGDGRAEHGRCRIADYFRWRGVPAHPRGLTDHECINWKPSADAPQYRWQFTKNGRDFTVNVASRVVTTDPVLNVRLAVAGVGVMIDIDWTVREQLESGELVSVLYDYYRSVSGLLPILPATAAAAGRVAGIHRLRA